MVLMDRDAVLEVTGLVKIFETDELPVAALRGVDLILAPGEFVAVMGPSGSGKSTLLNLISGLDRPTDGDVIIAGQSLSRADERQLSLIRREHIGLVFQFFHLLEGMTVLENVMLPAVIAGASRRKAETRARDLLDLLALTAKASEMPGVLSGGQRQRLALARALANQPTLLLADEPTGSLDSDGVDEVLELLRRLHHEGQTILLVTHDPTVAAAAGRVVTMRDGRILDGDEPASQPETHELRVSRLLRPAP
jgi:putative ABC transport system ATP-binding protein